MDPILSTPFLIGGIILVGGFLFSRFIPARPDDVLPAWVLGVFLALLVVPFLVYTGAKIIGTPVDTMVLLVIGLALASASVLYARRAKKK